jgi:hypothetical protein
LGELHPVDGRLYELARFLGIACETVLLPKAGFSIDFLAKTAAAQQSCLVGHPRVLEEWVGRDSAPTEWLSLLVSRFPYLLVHGLRLTPFDSNLLESLSGGRLRAVVELGRNRLSYEVSANAGYVCGAFAGLTFGEANGTNDRVFSGTGASGARELISIGGQPFMVEMARGGAKVLFLAGQDVADINAEVGDSPCVEYFSRLLPHAMALRYAFGDESWRPRNQQASVIIDDPPLWPKYGFLDFDCLLSLVEQHRFHASIAFIPHNFRRSSATVVRSALNTAGRLSICFHGNDHTGAELASTEPVLLNTTLHIAEERMRSHLALTGVDCDRVMVFPQGRFSVEAMEVLKARNFDAALNTVSSPFQQPVRLRLSELAQPAVLRYAGFPLFLREDSVHTQVPEIAFKVFFGRPVFIVEHHHIFKDPAPLLAAVSRVNESVPQIQWSSPACAVGTAVLWRRTADRAYDIRAYSRTIRVFNDYRNPVCFRIEWTGYEDGLASPVRVLRDGLPGPEFEATREGIAVSAELQAGAAHTFTVVHGNSHGMLNGIGVRRTVRGFVRRRLSELRDNHLSKTPRLLAAAELCRKRF